MGVILLYVVESFYGFYVNKFFFIVFDESIVYFNVFDLCSGGKIMVEISFKDWNLSY